jgi:hypothetical protein
LQELEVFFVLFTGLKINNFKKELETRENIENIGIE